MSDIFHLGLTKNDLQGATLAILYPVIQIASPKL